MKVVTIVGTRPELIKSRPVSRALRARDTEVLVHSGQHYDSEMSALFLDQLGIGPPEVQLVRREPPGPRQLAGMIVDLSEVLLVERPDWVLVYGDTVTTLAGALAASQLDLPLVHVEAGLRSYDFTMPEERSRVVTDHLSMLLLCPAHSSVQNLAAEGITGDHVITIGDVNLDALRMFEDQATLPEALRHLIGGHVLFTLHRQNNADDEYRLRRILEGLAMSGYPVVWPVHPRTSQRLAERRINVPTNVTVTPPLGFLDFLGLLRAAHCVVTDSGGVQKEAYWLHVPCVTARAETEWVETVDAGWNVLVDDHPTAIASAIKEGNRKRPHPDLYGDGQAAPTVQRALTVASQFPQMSGNRKLSRKSLQKDQGKHCRDEIRPRTGGGSPDSSP